MAEIEETEKNLKETLTQAKARLVDLDKEREVLVCVVQETEFLLEEVKKLLEGNSNQ